jgi:hypothetical protein
MALCAFRGHGTMMQNEGDEQQLVATVCGCIQRLNKLVMVQPFTGRCVYAPFAQHCYHARKKRCIFNLFHVFDQSAREVLPFAKT